MTTQTMHPLAFGVSDSFGSGGEGLAPDGATGPFAGAASDDMPARVLRDHLRALYAATHPPVADATALTATLARNRADGQLVVKLDDYSIWVWKAADATAADATHVKPTDVGSGNGRWVRKVA